MLWAMSFNSILRCLHTKDSVVCLSRHWNHPLVARCKVLSLRSGQDFKKGLKRQNFGSKCFLSTTHFAKIGMGCDLDFIRLYIKEMYASKLCCLVLQKHILEYGKTYIHNQFLGKFIKNEQEWVCPNYSNNYIEWRKGFIFNRKECKTRGMGGIQAESQRYK